MITITLDIETVTHGLGQPEWNEGERGWEPDKFAPIPYHRPVVVSWLLSDIANNMFKLNHFIEGVTSEKLALRRLSDDFNVAKRLITYNGRGFDMPILQLRALHLGVDWGFWDDWKHRFPNFKKPLLHYDMSDLLTDFGGAPKFGLDPLCRMLGIPGKTDMHGSEVGKAWFEGPQGRERVRKYCDCDVIDLYLIYLKYMSTRSKFDYDTARQVVLQFVSTTDIKEHYQ